MFAKHLDSLCKLNSDAQSSVFKHLLKIFTNQAVLGEPNTALYNVLIAFATDGMLFHVIEAYNEIAHINYDHIKQSLCLNDFKRSHGFPRLQRGRLDGNVAAFVTKFVVEMALAMHYSAKKDIKPSIALAVLFAGLNFSPTTGKAACNDVRSFQKVQCNESISFSDLLAFCDQNGFPNIYNSKSVWVLN